MSCVNCTFKNSSAKCDTINSFNWLKDIPGNENEQIIEITFKNRRKDYYINKDHLTIAEGDAVVVEAQAGHDLGIVSLTGILAKKNFIARKPNMPEDQIKTIYRHATTNDKLQRSLSRKKEYPTLLRARIIAKELGLDMKLSDAEFQADGKRVVFYYIADGRIDFRELIKVYALEFNVKIEMRQIGARQEAAKIGGIGDCGRELCCSSWRKDLPSIKSNVFRIQNLSPDVQKYTGACGKLKCCLMYELDTYLDAQEQIPSELLDLETKKGIAYHHKTDILSKVLWYSFDLNNRSNLIGVPLERVKEIIGLNKKGVLVTELTDILDNKKNEFTNQ